MAELQSFDMLVHQERQRQDEKWGEQNHNPYIWIAILLEEIGELARAVMEYHFREGATKDINNELIQVVAVAKAMFESGKRNGWL